MRKVDGNYGKPTVMQDIRVGFKCGGYGVITMKAAAVVMHRGKFVVDKYYKIAGLCQAGGNVTVSGARFTLAGGGVTEVPDPSGFENPVPFSPLAFSTIKTEFGARFACDAVDEDRRVSGARTSPHTHAPPHIAAGAVT